MLTRPRSAEPPPSCFPTQARASPAKRFTSIAATTSWVSDLIGKQSRSALMPKLTIAIDGPAGSGKSSVARRVAELLQYLYLDSGAMYRALALKALKRGIPLNDESRLERLAKETRIELKPPTSEHEAAGAKNCVLLAGAGGGVVMEGRDIGTVVFPSAELKIFLDAAPETRAERRWKEHREKGDKLTLAEVFDEVIERDKRDRERKVSPLVRATDAVLVDNTAMGIEETARLIVMLAQERERELARAGRPG